MYYKVFDNLEWHCIKVIVLNWVLKKKATFCEAKLCLVIVCGVPLGLVLGPRLFILYNNNICSVLKVLKMALFADDMCFFVCFLLTVYRIYLMN